MSTCLITGGSGFFGGILKNVLLEAGHSCINIDLQPDIDRHPQLTSWRGDICTDLERAAGDHQIDVIFHCAAQLAHDVRDQTMLWRANVDGTRRVAEFARARGIKKIVFISSNCLWGRDFGRPIREDDEPEPIEVYGRSKYEGEKVLAEFAGDFECVILRSPTIIEEGRLGLLGILFEFIDENRRIYVVGDGSNRYQFIYARDLADACMRSWSYSGSATFNVGSDQVPTLRQVYESVIAGAGSKSRVVSLPRAPTIFAMRLAHRLGISPLGPYHYRMIAESFVFDTSRLKAETGWAPTLTNEAMLLRAYLYYRDHRAELDRGRDVSAHKRTAQMGVIRLLKWLS